MAVRLVKNISDTTLKNWTNPTSITVNGVFGSPENLIDFSFQSSQTGGSFSASFIGNSTFQLNSEINVFRGYTGTIKSTGRSITNSGNLAKVGGVLTPPGSTKSIRASFESSDPFLIDGQIDPDHIANQVPVFGYSNYYRLFGMSARTVFQKVAEITGTPITVNIPFDFPIYKYSAVSNQVFEVLEEIAKACGANAILRSDGIHILGWRDTIDSHTFSFEDVLNGIEVIDEASQYDAVSIQAASTITPWNSTYAGPPERIATLNFEAGIQSLNDTGGASGVTRQQDGWFYPKDGLGNVWAAYNSAAPNEGLFTTYGTSVWDIEKAGTEVDYTPAPFLSQAEVSDIALTNPGVVNDTQYNVLLRWNTAAYKFSGLGDVYPFVYIVPGDAPRFLNSFNIEDKNNSARLKDSQVFPTAGVNSGTPLTSGIFAPAGYGVPLRPTSSSPTRGFASDGSCYLTLEPLAGESVPIFGSFQPKVLPNSLKKIIDDVQCSLKSKNITTEQQNRQSGSAVHNKDYRKSLNATDVSLLLDPLETPPTDNTGMSQDIDESKIVTVNFPTSSTLADADKKKILRNIASSITGRKYNLFCIESNDGTWLTSRIIGVAIAENKLSMSLSLEKAPGITSDYSNGSLILGIEQAADVSNGNNLTDLLAFAGGTETVTDSGYPGQRKGPIKGTWSIFGLKRRVYPATAFALVGGTGVDSVVYSNQAFTVNVDNVKSASSNLVTDFWGANVQSTHLGRLTSYLAAFLGQDFKSFSVEIIDQNFDIPQVGDSVTINGIPDLGSVTGKVISVNYKLNLSGATFTVTCGRLPTL